VQDFLKTNAPADPIRVFIVARHATVRAGLRYALSTSPRLEVVGEAASAGDAADILDETAADVIVADDPLLDRAQLRDTLEEARRSVVLISEDPDSAAALAGSSAFGWAVMLPSADADAIVGAIGAVASGLIAVDRGLHGLFQRPAAGLGDPPDPSGLTPREAEVLQHMAAGLANKQIAARLGVSAHTVKFHVASILSKLGASTRAEAVAIAARRGFLMV
jgi:DNA-binding NarL/FixJ family response regulator